MRCSFYRNAGCDAKQRDGVAQASSLWGGRASRLPHSQDGCATAGECPASLHPVERLLQNVEVACAAELDHEAGDSEGL